MNKATLRSDFDRVGALSPAERPVLAFSKNDTMMFLLAEDVAEAARRAKGTTRRAPPKVRVGDRKAPRQRKSEVEPES